MLKKPKSIFENLENDIPPSMLKILQDTNSKGV